MRDTFINFIKVVLLLKLNLYGYEEYRNKGIGQQLLEWAIRRAKEKRAYVVQLTTDKKRLGALQFYEKLGFKSSREAMRLHLT